MLHPLRKRPRLCSHVKITMYRASEQEGVPHLPNFVRATNENTYHSAGCILHPSTDTTESFSPVTTLHDTPWYQ